MAFYNVNEGQSLLDIALELYGSPEYIVQLARDNNLTLNDDLSGLLVLRYDAQQVGLVDTATYYRLQGLHVVTALNDVVEGIMLEHSESEHTFTEHN